MKSVITRGLMAAVFFVPFMPELPAQTAAAGLQGGVENGERQYMELKCWACHGYTGETGDGTRLNPPRMNQTAFIAYVRRPSGAKLGPGPGNSMPPYAGTRVSDQDLADIHAWLEALPSTSPSPEDIPLLKR